MKTKKNILVILLSCAFFIGCNKEKEIINKSKVSEFVTDNDGTKEVNNETEEVKTGEVVNNETEEEVNNETEEVNNKTIENLFTEYSVWKYTNGGTVIELTFYPGKMQIKSTPEEVEYPYLLGGNGGLGTIDEDFSIKDNKIYFKHSLGDSFDEQFCWYVWFLSENEIVWHKGGYLPAMAYITTYHFIRQSN